MSCGPIPRSGLAGSSPWPVARSSQPFHRSALALLAAMLIAAFPVTARGQQYPVKPVRILTAQVGGGTDFVARLIAQGLTESLKQPAIVENRGGNVVLSAEAVAKAAPDGYTLLIYAATLW